MEWIHNMDVAVTNFIYENMHFPTLDSIFRFFSMIGEYGVFWISIGIILFIFKKTRKCGFLLLFSVGLSFLFGEIIIKNIICRARPFIDNPDLMLLITPPYGYSFPSSHTSSSFAAATAIFICNKTFGNIALLIALMVGFSRIYLHVHYLSDVAAGIILGILCAATASFIYFLFNKRENSILRKLGV